VISIFLVLDYYVRLRCLGVGFLQVILYFVYSIKIFRRVAVIYAFSTMSCCVRTLFSQVLVLRFCKKINELTNKF
jgi:hypothetical protein